MNYIKDLRAELDSNAPLYGGLSNAEVVATINAKDISRDITNVSGSQLWEATDSVEYGLLTDAEKSQWLALCGISHVNPFGPAQGVVTGIFPGGSNTLNALKSLRKEFISRATELGFQQVKEGHVEMARALP